MQCCLWALLGQELPPLPFSDRQPNSDAVATLLDVIAMHKPQWTSLAAWSAFVAYSPAEFAEHDQRQRDEELAATAALASLSMVGEGEERRAAGEVLERRPGGTARWWWDRKKSFNVTVKSFLLLLSFSLFLTPPPPPPPSLFHFLSGHKLRL